MALKTHKARQDLRRALPAAGGAVPWRKLALRTAVSLALLVNWLALSYMLPSFLEEWGGGRGGLVGKIFRFYLPFYLQYWEEWTCLGAIWCIAIWGLRPLWRAMQAPRFSDAVVGAATPEALGAIRAWTCGILLLLTLREDLASSALLPRTMFRWQGFMALLHLLPTGFDEFLANATALWAFQSLTSVLLVFGVLGLGTRLVVPAAAICYLVLGGIYREHSFFNHSGIIPLYVLAVLSFTRCDQGWAVDRLWRAARGKPVAPAQTPTAYFGWARYAVWTVIAVPYVEAGCSKLYYMGWHWVSADSMRWMLLRTTLELDRGAFDFDMAVRLLPMPEVLFVVLGVIALGTEVAFGLVLVSRRARLVLPAAMVGVHLGILLLQNILFLDLVLLLWVFYDWDAPRRWLSRRRGTPAGASTAGPAGVPDAATHHPARTHRLGALAVMAMLLFLASWWVTKIRLYPLTPLKMFTQHKKAADTGVVSYVRAIAHYEDGSSGRAPFGRWIGAMRGGRYRPFVRNMFRDSAGLETGKQFLDAALCAANTRDKVPRVSSVEIQMWHWNFKDDPDNPNRGIMTDRHIHPAPRQGACSSPPEATL